MSRNQVTGAVDRATDSPWFERLARAGHAVSGLLHLLIAYIILRLAFGGGGNADQSGALGIFADSSGGRVVLWVAAVAVMRTLIVVPRASFIWLAMVRCQISS